MPLPDGSALWGKCGAGQGYRSGVFASRDPDRRTVCSPGASSSVDSFPAVAPRLAGVTFVS